MSAPAVAFGPIIDGDDVEQAVVASLSIWLNDYLGERERAKGYAPNTIARPRGIIASSELEKWPEDQLPVVVVVSGGIEKPRKGAGSYDGTWTIAVAPVVSDVNALQTRKLGLAYVAACRAVLVQHKRLKSSLHPSGFATNLHWEGERYDGMAFGDTRSLFAPHTIFTLQVDNAVEVNAGPREPYADPTEIPGDWPDVTSIKVGAHIDPITGALT